MYYEYSWLDCNTLVSIAIRFQSMGVFVGVFHDALTFKLWKEDASTRGKFFLATLCCCT
jgi:hypothetical protein